MPQLAKPLALIVSLSLAVIPGAMIGAGAARAQGSSDLADFRSAVTLAGNGDWVAAEAQLGDSGTLVRDLLRWMRLRDGPRAPDALPDPRDPDPSFGEYTAFLAAHPHWPGLDRLRMQGERTIPADAAPGAVLAWFAGVKPQTGQGAAALARALLAEGRMPEARAVVEEAWLTLGLDNAAMAALMSGWADILAPLHQARADEMLWRWRSRDAERMLPYLTSDQRLLAEARIALIRDAGDQAARVAAVPEALRNDPGLAVDRFNRLAEDGDYSDAVALLLDRTDSVEALGQPFRWASWRATLARWALREGRPQDALRLAASHHLTEGGPGPEFLADLEWIAGFTALRYLNDPGRALGHFRRMESVVTGPISIPRAAYWAGRAQEAAGNPEAARADYARAANYQTAFYGLLAAERLGQSLDPSLTGTEGFGDWRSGPVLQNDLTAAMLMLSSAGATNDAVLFAARLGQTLPRAELGQLGAMLAEAGEHFLTLVAAKAGQERGILIPAMHYPLHPLATLDLPVAPELALAIARQESEFNIAAGSGVGALGLMQLMPGTAQDVARDLGQSYERARLTTDWAYNATLGSAYLAGLEQRFGASPVMVAAGYNAGPARPRTWMSLRGDPRIGTADPIDWIELIPFTETRNYVMRVTEAMPIYQARLTGQTGPVALMPLLRGAAPVLRPQARPVRDEGLGSTLAAAVAAALPTASIASDVSEQEPAPQVTVTGGTTSLAPERALRPVARP